MASNDYHFITDWRVHSNLQEINEVIGNGPDLVRWWPSVYLDVKELEQGDEHGIGKVIDLYTKGWLPYTLRWSFRIIENRQPHGFTLEAWGDFVGRGIWTFEQDGDWVNITYDWQVSAGKPLLRNLSWLLKPVFSANHHWAMQKGEESLQLELARRHAKTAQERARIPPPPGRHGWSTEPNGENDMGEIATPVNGGNTGSWRTNAHCERRQYGSMALYWHKTAGRPGTTAACQCRSVHGGSAGSCRQKCEQRKA